MGCLWGEHLLPETGHARPCPWFCSASLAQAARSLQQLTLQPSHLALVEALVPHQVLLAGEAFLAEKAPVGPLPRMQPPVGGQVLLANEGLATLTTGVGPLPSVDHLVPQEIGVVVEPAPTLAADVGAGLRVPHSHPCWGTMAPLVEVQVDLQSEAFLALRAGVRAFARVPQAVLAQARLVREAAPTFGTGVNFGSGLEGRWGLFLGLRRGPGVGPLVQGTLLLVQEAFPAVRADVRGLARKGPLLDDDGGEIGNASAALGRLKTASNASHLPANTRQAFLREVQRGLIQRLWQGTTHAHICPRRSLGDRGSICREKKRRN